MTAVAHTIPPVGTDPAYAPGKLVLGVHEPLVARLEEFADKAGIPPAFITGAQYALTDFERDYLVGFRRLHHTGALGLIYSGTHSPDVLDRTRSIVGALVRNYIDARLVMRDELVTLLFNGKNGPQEPLVAVPDFHAEGIPTSAAQSLKSWLTGRMARGRQTVLGFPSVKAVDALFKPGMVGALQHFETLHGSQPSTQKT